MDLDAVAERVRRDRERAALSAASARRAAGAAAFATLASTSAAPQHRAFPTAAPVENLASVVRGQGTGPNPHAAAPAIHKHTAARTGVFTAPSHPGAPAYDAAAASFERAVLAGAGLPSTSSSAALPSGFYVSGSSTTSALGGLGEGPGMAARHAAYPASPASPSHYGNASSVGAGARPALDVAHSAAPGFAASGFLPDGVAGGASAEGGPTAAPTALSQHHWGGAPPPESTSQLQQQRWDGTGAGMTPQPTPPATPGRGGVAAPSPRPRGTPSSSSSVTGSLDSASVGGGWAAGTLRGATMETTAVDLPPPAAGPVPLAKRLLMPPSEDELREAAAAAAAQRRGGRGGDSSNSRGGRRAPPSSAHDDFEDPPPPPAASSSGSQRAGSSSGGGGGGGGGVASPLSRIAASIRARRTLMSEPASGPGGTTEADDAAGTNSAALDLPRAARSSLAADISGTATSAAPPAAPLPGSLAHRLGLRQSRPAEQAPPQDAVAAPSPRPRHPSFDASTGDVYHGGALVTNEVVLVPVPVAPAPAVPSSSPASRRANALSQVASLAASAASYAMQISSGGGGGARAGAGGSSGARGRSAGRARSASPPARAASASRGKKSGGGDDDGAARMPPQLAFSFPVSPGRRAPPRSRSPSRDRLPGVATVYSPVPFQSAAREEADEEEEEEEAGNDGDASMGGSTTSRPTASRASSPAGSTARFGARSAQPGVAEDTFADFSDRVKRYEAIRERKLREQEQRKAAWSVRRQANGEEDASPPSGAFSGFLPANVLAPPPAGEGQATGNFTFGGRVPLRRRDRVSAALAASAAGGFGSGVAASSSSTASADTPAAVSALPDVPVSAPPILHIPLPPGAPPTGVIVIPAGNAGATGASVSLAAAAPALPSRLRPASAARSRGGGDAGGDAASVVSHSTRGRGDASGYGRPPSAAAASTVSSRLRSVSRSGPRGTSGGIASTTPGGAAATPVPGEGLADRVRRAGAISPSPAKTGGMAAVPGTTGGGSGANRAASPRIPVRPSLGGSTSVSNKQRIVNALSFVCLAGPHRSKELAAAMASLEACVEGGGVSHFLVLLASPESSAYKGLYALDPATGETVRVHGLGPLSLTDCVRETMGLPPLPVPVAEGAGDASVDGEEAASTADTTTTTTAPATSAPTTAPRFKVTALFKYDAVHRGFSVLPTAGVSLTTDALSIKALGSGPRRK